MLNFRIFFCCRAKARPNKKAWVNNPPEDQVVIEPEGPNPEATFDEPPLKITIRMNNQKLKLLCLMMNRQIQSGLMIGILVL